jgi:arylsulfate sulfotransferase
MKIRSTVIVGAVFMVFSHLAGASEADDTTITITGQTPGVTPFISQLTLVASNTTVLKSIQFTITPHPGSVQRPLSGTYSNEYLVSRGFEQPPSTEITLPVYGLYDGYTNTVTLTYRFLDGSSKQDSTAITTAAFADPCGYKNPEFVQHRDNNVDLSYDYVLIKGMCAGYTPAIIDADGALRWVGITAPNFKSVSATFFDNAIYFAYGPDLLRIDLDGAVTLVADYTSMGINDFHHTVERGKVGLILEADTPSYLESVDIEVDLSGKILKQWNMADIISAAMIAGGDDPSQFVYPSPTDWFHNNAVTYNRADDSLIVSSRENFLICIDYKTSAIKWILGDPTKKWYQFPSLRKFALTLASGSLPPIGQHSVSITFDQNILVLDNGQASGFQSPPGAQRNYSSPRKYKLDLNAKVATEVWNFEMSQSIFCPFCGSVYEDKPLNYLIDYASIGPLAPTIIPQLVGVNAAGQTAFSFQYPASPPCAEAFNSTPLHLENTAFPTVGPQTLNLSTRGTVASGDNALIGGFIVTGIDPKTIVFRALGPSLTGSGVSGALADPVLTVYDSSGTVIATNDDWQTDQGASEIAAEGLAPTNPSESATLQSLAPAAYTVAVTGKDSTPGISLVEIYDLSPGSNSKLANIATRGSVGLGDSVLIGGFIVGDVASATVVVRALGPSLASFGVSDPLSDPTLTIYDVNGSAIASNDNWQDDINATDIQQNGLAPVNALESAIVLHLPAGAYSAIVRGTGDGTGVGLVEIYNL